MKKSITYLVTGLAIAASFSVSACSFAPTVTKNYTPTVEGYVSVKTPSMEEKKLAAASEPNTKTQDPRNVPVIINDPFAMGNSLAANQPSALGAAPVGTFDQNAFGGTGYANPYGGGAYGAAVPAPITNASLGSGNSPYGSINNMEGNMITPNVMMQNTAPVYQQPSYGSNSFSPTQSTPIKRY